MANLDFNIDPYYDDFDVDKKFYRILFKPGYAVQARELTQLQTQLQNQIASHGSAIYKEGAMVIPGQLSIDTKVDYVKLSELSTDISNIIGKTVVDTNGISALIVHAENATDGGDPLTIYVKYTNSFTETVSNVTSSTSVFESNSSLTIDGTYTATVDTTTPTGFGSIASIERGVYFIRGHFVLTNAQTIMLSKYDSVPTLRVGLMITESFITSDDDSSLLDNAQGSPNYAAPGADRYFIDLVLTSLALDSTADENFVELSRTDTGTIQRLVNTTEYSELEKTLARRTYDESGNYTVTPFKIDVREHRSNNRGAWASGATYLVGDVVTNVENTYVAISVASSGTSSTAPTHTVGSASDGKVTWEYNTSPYYNRGINLAGDESMLAIGLEPGKAYVEGYEISKIATEYVNISKARESVQVNEAVVSASVGNYLLVNSVHGIPPINTYATISLYDRIITSGGTAPTGSTVIGSANVRFIEWDNGTIGPEIGTYKLGLFNIKVNSGYDFNRDVKSVLYGTGNSTTSFSANIEPIFTQVYGSISTSGSSTTINGVGTSFITDFTVGDYIAYKDGSNNTVLKRITAISSQTQLTIDSAVTISSGVAVFLVTTNILEPDKQTSLFQLPYFAIKSLRNNTSPDYIYYVQKYYGPITAPSSGEIQIAAGSGVFASTDITQNYMVINASGGYAITPTITGAGTSTLTISGLTNTYQYVVIATIVKSDIGEKSKTLTPTSITLTTTATATLPNISLGHADCYRLVTVVMDTGTFASPTGTYTIDITDRYDFDTGMRDTFYDLGSINLKPSYQPPSAPIKIYFHYFAHSDGDFFSVDSYLPTIDYASIPYYNGIPLRDVIDFRPRVGDAGSTFSGTGSSVSLTPKRGYNFLTTYQYYLGRKSKIALDFNGNFFAVDGVSSLNPTDAQDPSKGMVLYNLSLTPYTFSSYSTDVNVQTYDNKRYTMRDIGKLEKRIDNLEYYTSLSLLEQQTNGTNIIDDQGLNRFKNGFIVDGFTGHNVGDTSNPDYQCAIDMENGIMRPFFHMHNVNLKENVSGLASTQDAARAGKKYQIYGDVITLPVTDHVSLVNQPYASRLENINPFAIFTFLGQVKVNPPSDEWFEVNRLPDIINNVEGNFNSLTAALEKQGALGTVWNSWQNSWTGKPVTTSIKNLTAGNTSRDELNRLGGNWHSSGNWQRREMTVAMEATEVGQSRTGVKTSVIAQIDRQVVGDRVLSTALIPYIRSRNVLVQARGLKPSTRFYPYFDGVDVSDYCTPASKIRYTPGNGKEFDYESTAGGDADTTPRRINGNAQAALNIGDVITGSSSEETAVVVGTEYDGTNNYLYVVNVSGTFTDSETLTGSLSGATGFFGSISTPAADSAAVSGYNGDVAFLFEIPNTDAVRFRCGERELKLVDSETYNGEYTSRGIGHYYAQGVLNTMQQTINSVRNGRIVQEQVKDNRVVVNTSERVVSDTGWYDPLAQTFLVKSEGGAFLSKVDIFFASKDPAIPVNLEIRNVVNGYPGPTTLPFSNVSLKPEKVNISGTTVVDNNGDTVFSYDTATTFEFPSPVYVQDNTEYAIVLSSDSNNYKVWVSQLGDKIPGSNRAISEQPYAGVLFKSQNASTWSADQMQDLKFTIYKAQFATKTGDGTIGAVEFVNDAVPYQDLDIDPFETRSGVAKVRVWQPNHGLTEGSYIAFDNYVADEKTTGTINGIPVAQVYGYVGSVANVDQDSYTIPTSSSATSSGYAGGSTVKATRNIAYDVIQPIVQMQTFPETITSVNVKTTSGKTPDSNQSAYVIDTSFIEVQANDNNEFNSTRLIASEVNETNNMSGNKSLTMDISIQTENANVSPIIDTQRTSAIVIGNRVNTPSETLINVANLDYRTALSSGTATVTSTTISSADSTAIAAFKTLGIGKYISISGDGGGSTTSSGYITNIDTASATAVVTYNQTTAGAPTGNITIVQRELFALETAPEGSSSLSKYVTKQIDFVNSSNYLRVIGGLSVPYGGNVEVWYRVGKAGVDLSYSAYTQITPDSDIVLSQVGSNQFIDTVFSTGDIGAFDRAQIKIVLTSSNTAAVPMVKDLRIIACA